MPKISQSQKRAMAESKNSEIPVIRISPPQSPPPKPKNEVVVIDLSDGFVSPPRNNFELASGTPMRPVFCVKNREKMKEIENREECFILEFDPDDDADQVSSDPTQFGDAAEASPEISVLAEKGKVACRDYPHSRHLCMKFPFQKSPHESFCHLCFCYVCDSSAPCSKWAEVGSRHCDAIDNQAWRMHRQLNKRSNT